MSWSTIKDNNYWITTELPTARQGESYCATILVEGGVPFLSGGKYEWSYDKDYSLVGIIFTQNNTKADLFTINGTPRCPGSYRISVTVTIKPILPHAPLLS